MDYVPGQPLDELRATKPRRYFDGIDRPTRDLLWSAHDNPAVIGLFTSENELKNALFLRLRSTVRNVTRKMLSTYLFGVKD
jgi:hypothetical protein